MCYAGYLGTLWETVRLVGKQRKRKVKGANATCYQCGRWAERACEHCERLLCGSCARVWPVEGEKGSHPGEIITCSSSRCQSKLSPELRRQAAALLAAQGGDGSDFEGWA
jgi:hypothetical protein